MDAPREAARLDPARLRLILAKTVLLGGVPLFGVLWLLTAGARWAPASAAAAAGLWSWFALALALRDRAEAQRAEAESLGYSSRTDGSSWNPMSWIFRGTRLALPPSLEPGARPEDFLLVRLAGLRANDRRASRLDGRRTLPPAVAATAVLAFALLFAASPRARPLWAALLGLPAAALWAVYGLWIPQGLLAEYGREEEQLGPGGFKRWPFWRHRIQRDELRDPRLLRRDIRLILKLAGVGGGKEVVELGAGASSLWEHVPRPRRRGWLLIDADPAALREAQRRGRGERFLCASAESIPLPAESADVVAALTLFDALLPGSLPQVLDETRRILKPGGTVVHLQDFPDHPGPDLARELNGLASRVLPGTAVGYDRWSYRLRLPRLDPVSRARLERGLTDLEPALPEEEAARAAFLRRVLASPEPPRAEDENPRKVFIELLTSSLRRRGFEVVSAGRELERALTYCVYLIARKPR